MAWKLNWSEISAGGSTLISIATHIQGRHRSQSVNPDEQLDSTVKPKMYRTSRWVTAGAWTCYFESSAVQQCASCRWDASKAYSP